MQKQQELSQQQMISWQQRPRAQQLQKERVPLQPARRGQLR